jgi:ribosomal 50S subunit-recycling heat shock protein
VRCNAALSFNLGKIMAKLSKLLKVNDSITINRYDNGWMVEIGGRNKKEEWATTKTLCNTEDELFALIKEYNTLELDQ